MSKAPFPWFGGKSKAADLIWSRFGTDCGNYVEPFFGSGAVWLARPKEFSGWATVNDLDGNVANLWRSMRYAPKMVADAACQPVNECDLHARHLWLVRNLPRLSSRLMADPDYHEPRTAGWWIWGACSWIGGGWCAGDGPWHAELGVDGIPALTLGDGRGVKRQLPHLGNGGTGVNRKLDWLNEWFADLQESMEGVRICCGDWERIMSPRTVTRNGIAAVLLDPPYSLTGAVYAHDSTTVSGDVRKWCIANGDNPQMRIALCGHDTEHNELEAMGWTVETWDKSGGYQGKDDRERIWFSPHCLGSTDAPQMSLF
ncbi:MAG: DNA adenine methylase [Fibrobacteres bacterium]|nr:DNA adenine methylase [Fibrobacterota bacterium]